MSFWLLPNTVGNLATSMAAVAGSTASGYSLLELISGPRNQHWRSAASISATSANYVLAADQFVTHIIAARADWMLTKNTARVRPTQRNSSNVWSFISGVDYNPLVAANLLGPKSQDLCFAVTPTVFRGYGLEFDSLSASETEAMQIAKLYASNGFQFDGEIVLEPRPEWVPIPSGPSANLFIPQRGYVPFEVESRIGITFRNCSRANIQAFKALPQLLNWPLFLFDDDSWLWSWKLEHVVIEGWEERYLRNDIHEIVVTFQRLKQYE